jgi:hypothetical protein
MREFGRTFRMGATEPPKPIRLYRVFRGTGPRGPPAKIDVRAALLLGS